VNAGKTLIILNPKAGSGRAGTVWRELEPVLWQTLGELMVAITQHPEEVALHLDKAQQAGLTRVIAIGGDGTNHALVNALAELNARNPDGPRMVYGNLPIGSGRDWARFQNIPLDMHEAARWIALAQPQATDVGLLEFDSRQEHFLNIASAGLSGQVAKRVNGITQRRPWSFLQATVQSILEYTPEPIQVQLDGQDWYEGKAFMVAVANGGTFGHGMRIAPHAATADGLFEVVLVKGVSRPTILSALYRVYTATHLTHPAVQYARAKQVTIVTPKPLHLDLDGESAVGQQLRFTLRSGLLDMLA
jgi:YegS/Rv2252/BmrU family lipid kinase